jgi:hypothetical protein
MCTGSESSFRASQKWVCGLMEIAESSYWCASRRRDEELRKRLVELARGQPLFGYRRLHALLRRRSDEPKRN